MECFLKVYARNTLIECISVGWIAPVWVDKTGEIGGNVPGSTRSACAETGNRLLNLIVLALA